MTPDEFNNFATTAVQRAVSRKGLVGYLILTQDRYQNGARLREPELRHAFAQECELQNRYYGIEVPTDEKYRFVDDFAGYQVSARHDFALFSPPPAPTEPKLRPLVLIEFKAGQPSLQEGDVHGRADVPNVRKDLQKLLRETSRAGVAMIHALCVADRTKVERVIDRYRVAWDNAIGRGQAAVGEKWFFLGVLVQGDPTRNNAAILYSRSAIDCSQVSPDFFRLDGFQLTELGGGLT